MSWHSKEVLDEVIIMCKSASCWTCGKYLVVMEKINLRFGELEKSVKGLENNMTAVQTEQGVATKESHLSLKKKIGDNTNYVKKATMAGGETTECSCFQSSRSFISRDSGVTHQD